MPKEIYNHQKKYDTGMRKFLADQSFSKANVSIYLEFDKLLQAEGKSYARLDKYLRFYKQLFRWLKMDILEASKEDLIRLAAEINAKKYKESVKKDYKSAVKYFYKTITILPKYEYLSPMYIWLYDKRNKFFSTNIDESKNKDKEEWFSEEDIIKILKVAGSHRNRCFISLLVSLGMRPEECLTIRKENVTKINNGIQLKVSGKTGVRDLFLYENYVIEHTLKHIDTIPKKQEYLFEFGLKMGNKILKQLCKKAGINKRAYLYKLRKFSVTRDMILGYSVGALMSKYGWTKKSGIKTISHYDKSIALDYRRETEEKHGIIDENVSKSILKDRICIRCGEKNNVIDNPEYCKKCSLRLDMTKEEIDKNTTNTEKEIDYLKKKLKKYETVLEKLYNSSI